MCIRDRLTYLLCWCLQSVAGWVCLLRMVHCRSFPNGRQLHHWSTDARTWDDMWQPERRYFILLLLLRIYCLIHRCHMHATMLLLSSAFTSGMSWAVLWQCRQQSLLQSTIHLGGLWQQLFTICVTLFGGVYHKLVAARPQDRRHSGLGWSGSDCYVTMQWSRFICAHKLVDARLLYCRATRISKMMTEKKLKSKKMISVNQSINQSFVY